MKYQKRKLHIRNQDQNLKRKKMLVQYLLIKRNFK